MVSGFVNALFFHHIKVQKRLPAQSIHLLLFGIGDFLFDPLSYFLITSMPGLYLDSNTDIAANEPEPKTNLIQQKYVKK